MKKRIFSMVLLALFFYNVHAQCDFYFANNQRQHWQEDSSSVNIIVTNMQNYDLIVRNLQTVFSTSDDTVWCANDDNNIIVISEKLPSIDLSQLIASISPNQSDIAFVTYAKKINNTRIWLRHEAYLRLKHDSLYSTYLQPYLSTFTNFTLRYDGLQKEYIITCDDERMLMEIANGLYDNQYVA